MAEKGRCGAHFAGRYRLGIEAALAAAIIVLSGTAAAQGDGAASLQDGDPERGRIVFFRCKACHSLESGALPGEGPHLKGIFGRRAGSLDGYSGYSAALRDADFVWTERKLDEWLRRPNEFLPGNTMSFAGIRKNQDRRDLLAYLRQATGNP